MARCADANQIERASFTTPANYSSHNGLLAMVVRGSSDGGGMVPAMIGDGSNDGDGMVPAMMVAWFQLWW